MVYDLFIIGARGARRRYKRGYDAGIDANDGSLCVFVCWLNDNDSVPGPFVAGQSPDCR